MLSSATAAMGSKCCVFSLTSAVYNMGLTEVECRSVALRAQCEDRLVSGHEPVDKELDVRKPRISSCITRNVFPGWAERDRKEPGKLQLGHPFVVRHP